jgi:hypothetical protein
MSRLFTTRLFEMNPRGAVRRGGFGSSSSTTFTFCHSRLPAAKNPNPSAKARPFVSPHNLLAGFRGNRRGANEIIRERGSWSMPPSMRRL